MKTNTREIHRGEDKVLVLTLREKDSGDAIDLTGISSAEATFTGDAGDVVKTLGAGGITVTSATKGRMEVALDEADTAALKVGNNQDFKIKVVIGTDTKIKKVKNALNVIDC